MKNGTMMINLLIRNLFSVKEQYLLFRRIYSARKIKNR